ncbi:MAG: NnrS family protein [Altererythrobacter sp.]|nr:NnrS family protein [Altererythrobacter sp.]
MSSTSTANGRLALPTALDPLAWHRHEMLFGFVGAIVAGFLLTAIPNWTGRPPIAGGPLAALFALWLAGRLVLLASTVTGLVPALLFDAGFYIVLGLVAAREVVAGKNRNPPSRAASQSASAAIAHAAPPRKKGRKPLWSNAGEAAIRILRDANCSSSRAIRFYLSGQTDKNHGHRSLSARLRQHPRVRAIMLPRPTHRPARCG